YHQTFEAGVALFNGGQTDSAFTVFQNLRLLDTSYAGVHFYIGRCYEKKNNTGEALREYIQARDYDQLRFRASSDMNNIIRTSCDRENEFFVDTEKMFKDNSHDSLIGHELIVEHLHPNSRGYFLMAKQYAHEMRAHQLFASAEEWNNAHPFNEDELWESRHVTEFDEQLAHRKTEILTSSWPFTKTTSHSPRLINPSDTLESIVENVMRGNGNWLDGHEQFANYYLRRGEREKAAKEFEVIINQAPYDVQPYLKLAHIYLEMGKIEKVQSTLTASLAVEKTILANRALGDIALRQNKPLDAVSYYEKLAMFSQTKNEQLQNGYMLALALVRAYQNDAARNQLQLLLQINPNFTPARELLSKTPAKIN
ncbi:MAG: hypothetical protein PHP42_05540, partial [Bacteroidota bacterium]|nr:hypothetical protein [Bacteroidota bacterium]